MASETHKPHDDIKLKDPHLIDVGDPSVVLEWIVLAALSGAIGNAAYDSVRAAAKELVHLFRTRHGRSKVRELRRQVEAKIDKADISCDDQATLNREEAKRRVEEMFLEQD